MAVWSIVDAVRLRTVERWDAEYSQPRFLELAETLTKHGCKPLGDYVAHAARGCAPAYAQDGDVAVVRSVNVRELEFSDARRETVRKDFHRTNPDGQIREGNIAITSTGVGTLGRVFCNLSGREFFADGHITVLRLHDESEAPFLTAVLQSRIGAWQFEQRQRGSSGQIEIYPEDILDVRIPTFPQSLRNKIGDTWSEAVRLVESAEKLYPDAEAELLDGLGWEELRRQPVELCYVRDFADLAAAARADAEFFQPQYARLRAQLTKRGAQTVGAFCAKPSRGVQPLLIEGGEVAVVDSKAVRPQGVEPSTAERTTRAFHDSPKNAKGRVRRGDVLLNSTGRGTLGRAACYQLETPALCDNHVAILRPDARVCHPVYLALFLNSPAGLAQSEQFQTGSSGQLEIYPEHIHQFLISLPRQKNGTVDLAWQERLAAKVEAATAAKAAARAKLEDAKRLVEEALNSKATEG